MQHVCKKALACVYLGREFLKEEEVYVGSVRKGDEMRQRVEGNESRRVKRRCCVSD